MKKMIGLIVCMVSIFAISTPIYSMDGEIGQEISPNGGFGQETTPYVYSVKELKVIEQKRNQALLESIQFNSSRSYDDGVYITLNVPYYEQEETYYCGPATVKQVSHFMTGSSDSQVDIAEIIGTGEAGTTMAYMLEYLNGVKDLDYIYDQGIAENYSTWLNAIYSSARNSKPAIILVSDPYGNILPYTTPAHFVNLSGVDSKYSSNKIRITDPFTYGLGNIWYYASDIHSLNYNDPYTWRRALIW